MLFFVGRIAADFRAYMEERGIAYGQFAAEGKVPPRAHAYPIDFTDSRTIIESLQKLPDLPEVTAILTTGYEHYVMPAAVIAGYFKLPSMPIEAARAATDKVVMRRKFAAYNPAITPAFTHVTRWEDVAEFVQTHEFPVMLKPTNLMKSLYVTKNHDVDELRRNYERVTTALPEVYERYHLQEPGLIVEEFLSGSMHTVAGFVDSRGTAFLAPDIVDCTTAQEIGRKDNYLFARTLPSRLSPEVAASVLDVTRQGIAALGLTNTPVHAELMLTEQGPKIIEIGARMGGYRPRMYGVARGVDMYKAAIATALGEEPELSASQARACAVLEIFGENMGPLHEISSLAQIKELASYQYVRTQTHTGALTGRAADGFRAPLVVMLGHPDPQQVERDTRWILANVRVSVQAD